MTSIQTKRLLVTGGRGRLASLVAEHFRLLAYEVELYSRSEGTGFHSLAELTHNAKLHETDTLLHMAWSTLPATSEQNPGSEIKHDLPLLEKLLLTCRVCRPHFVFFSSGGTVYGNAPGRPNVENDQGQPIGSYGRAKLAAENLVTDVANSYGLPCTILRIANPYGYSVPSGRAQGIIPHAIRAALEGKPLTLWGDGHARRNFIYYTDFLSALDEVVTRRLTGVYNLSANESHSVVEIIAMAKKYTGKKISTTMTPAPDWDVQDSRLSNQRLITETNWRPQITLDEGIRRSIADYTSNLTHSLI